MSDVTWILELPMQWKIRHFFGFVWAYLPIKTCIIQKPVDCFANQLNGFYMLQYFTDSRFRAYCKQKQRNYVTVISEAVIQMLSEIIQKSSQKMENSQEKVCCRYLYQNLLKSSLLCQKSFQKQLFLRKLLTVVFKISFSKGISQVVPLQVFLIALPKKTFPKLIQDIHQSRRFIYLLQVTEAPSTVN